MWWLCDYFEAITIFTLGLCNSVTTCNKDFSSMWLTFDFVAYLSYTGKPVSRPTCYLTKVLVDLRFFGIIHGKTAKRDNIISIIR